MPHLQCFKKDVLIRQLIVDLRLRLCGRMPCFRFAFAVFVTHVSASSFSQRFQKDLHLSGCGIELSKFVIEFSFPEFIGRTLGEWFSKGIDSLATGVPGFVTGIDGNSMVDEPSPDGALHLVDPLIECFPILDD